MNKFPWRQKDVEIIAAVASSYSYAEALRALGVPLHGSSNATIRNHIKRLELDTSHFTGQLWSKGKILKTAPEQVEKTKVDLLANYLKAGSDIGSSRLKERLFLTGLKETICENCSLSNIWQEQDITLQLDHINGIRNDNRLENLRILCPNCHSQTPTHSRGIKSTEAIHPWCYSCSAPTCNSVYCRTCLRAVNKGLAGPRALTYGSYCQECDNKIPPGSFLCSECSVKTRNDLLILLEGSK